MLLELGLPGFDTLIFNSRVSLSHQCLVTQNGFTGHICGFILSNFLCFIYSLCVCAYESICVSCL